MKRSIRLCGMNGSVKGRAWEGAGVLRVGREKNLELVIEDASVSRTHAEIRPTERGWRVRDLGSTNGTKVNGVLLKKGTEWPLHVRDMLQFGEVTMNVQGITEMADDSGSAAGVPNDMEIAATSKASWTEAMENVAELDVRVGPRAGEKLVALLRASQHLARSEREEDLLSSILDDAVRTLNAQRGAIVLAEGPNGGLRIKALTTGRVDPRAAMNGRSEPSSRFQFSQSLATRCFERGESILCKQVDDDPEVAMARSIAEGQMSSVLCVLLRTPRRSLGVLHLDRGPLEAPFLEDDLHLADALAASVSAGIECAQLLRKQRDLFLDTINILADAVELRDAYTGNHTQRVTTYALLLAEHMQEPMGLTADQMHLLRIGTPLHDVGKIGIPDAILLKPGKLDDDEFDVMKKHTVMGAEIVNRVPDLRPIIPIVRSHHERWDGRGYPDGQEGAMIDPLARIVSLADAFDAMTSDRPYRKGMPATVAFDIIQKEIGKQFDPVIARGFLDIRGQILEEMEAQSSQQLTKPRTRVVAV
ncbi:MAG: HD domain-containing protein [Gemmataceae bacterium]